MKVYERFETVISWILTTVVAAIIVIALLRLVITIYSTLVVTALTPLSYRDFENIFGMVMTLLIALEFNHSIRHAIDRQRSVVQVRTVLLIAILSLARKFIILDIGSAGTLVAAMALAVLALGVVHFLLSRERNGAAP